MIWFSDRHTKEIKSPVIGIFYDAATSEYHREYNPKPYVEEGSQVTPETVVCDVEIMGVIHPIKAEVYGTIEEKLVSSGEAVEYDQVLFKITSSE